MELVQTFQISTDLTINDVVKLSDPHMYALGISELVGKGDFSDGCVMIISIKKSGDSFQLLELNKFLEAYPIICIQEVS